MRSIVPTLLATMFFVGGCDGGDGLLDPPDAGNGGDDAAIDAGTVPFERCPNDAVSIESTIEGANIEHVSEGYTTFEARSVAPTALSSVFGENGYLYASTATTYEGMSTAATAIVIFPDDTPLGGRAYCADGLSSVRSTGAGPDRRIEATLRELSAIGSCADATASTDTLSVCIGRSGNDCPKMDGSRAQGVFSGVVRATPFEHAEDPTSYVVVGESNTDVSILFAGGRGFADLKVDGDHHVGQMVWRGADPLEPPVVYCVTRAEVDLTATHDRIEFEALSLRGDCAQATPEVSGVVEICL